MSVHVHRIDQASPSHNPKKKYTTSAKLVLLDTLQTNTTPAAMADSGDGGEDQLGNGTELEEEEDMQQQYAMQLLQLLNQLQGGGGGSAG